MCGGLAFLLKPFFFFYKYGTSICIAVLTNAEYNGFDCWFHSAVGQMRTGISSSASIVITLPAQAKLEVIKFESLELC